MLICKGEIADPAGLHDNAVGRQRHQRLLLLGVALGGRLPGADQARGRSASTEAELDVSPGDPDSRNRLVALFGILSGVTLTGQSAVGSNLRWSLGPVLNAFFDTFSC